MTFRPSVLPDRDNDILSTFVRSFERARQLVRQDQADNRAQQIHDLDVRERTRALEDRELETNLQLATTPGLRTDISRRQAEVASIFGKNAAGEPTAEVRPPAIFRGRRASVPRELMPPPGTPGDTQIVGERDGRTITFSQMMADRIRRDRARGDAEFEETLPAARRAATDRAELDESVAAMLEEDPILDAQGNPIPAERITSAEFGQDLIEAQRDERAALARGVAVAATPRTTSGRPPEALPSATGARVNAIQRAVEEEARERLIAEAGPAGVLPTFVPRPFTDAEKESMRREAVNRAFRTGVITPQQRDALLARGQGAAPLAQEEVSGLDRQFRGMDDDDVREIMQGSDFTGPEIEFYIENRAR